MKKTLPNSQTTQTTKMSWENLPIEIRVEILSIRYDLRYTASNKIQNGWKKYMLPEVTAMDISLDIEIDSDEIIMVSLPQTANLMEICAHIIRGKHNQDYWLVVMEGIKEGLVMDEYTGGPSAVYYNRTEKAYHKILNKLGIE